MQRLKPCKDNSLENFENEEWLDIHGYEGLYQVSSKGRIKSLARKVWVNRGRGYYANLKALILRPSLGEHGSVITLCKDGNEYTCGLGGVIGYAFFKDFDFKSKLGYRLFHLNKDKDDYSVENLILKKMGDGMSDIVSSSIANKGKKYKGVYHVGKKNPYYRSRPFSMEITIDHNKFQHYFETALDAAKKYDSYIKEYNLKRKGNFIDEQTN